MIEQLRIIHATLAEAHQAVAEAIATLDRVRDEIVPTSDAVQAPAAEATPRRTNGRAKASARPEPPRALVCEACGEAFQRRRRSGPVPRFCSSGCQRRAKAPEKEPQPAADVEQPDDVRPESEFRLDGAQSGQSEPEPDAETRFCARCQQSFQPSQPEQRFCSRECKRDQRRENKWPHAVEAAQAELAEIERDLEVEHDPEQIEALRRRERELTGRIEQGKAEALNGGAA